MLAFDQEIYVLPTHSNAVNCGTICKCVVAVECSFCSPECGTDGRCVILVDRRGGEDLIYTVHSRNGHGEVWSIPGEKKHSVLEDLAW